jgi:hypothetical protein
LEYGTVVAVFSYLVSFELHVLKKGQGTDEFEESGGCKGREFATYVNLRNR